MNSIRSAPVVDDPIAEDVPISRQRIVGLIAEAFPSDTPAITTIRMVDEGQGYTSIILIANLQWNPQQPATIERPHSVILKLPVTYKIWKMTEGMTGGDDAAPGFSEEAALQLMLSANNIEGKIYTLLNNAEWGAIPPVKMPRLYLTKQMADFTSEGALMLEDLSGVADTPKDLVDGMTEAQIHDMFEQVARLQAFAISNRDAWAGKYNTNPFTQGSLQEFCKSVPSMYKNLENNWSEHYPYKFNDVKHMWEEERVEPVLNGQKIAPSNTVLVHGDLWMNNLLCEDGGRGPVRALIDWQICHAGSCAEDLARLMSIAVTPEFRRTRDKELLNKFYCRLTELLGSRPPFTFEELEIQYEMHLAFQMALFGGLCVFLISDQGPARHESHERKIKAIQKGAASTADALPLYEKHFK